MGERGSRYNVEWRPAPQGVGEAYGQGVVGGRHTGARTRSGQIDPAVRARPLRMEDGHRPINPPLKEGSFSISDWTGYPDWVPRPNGPFRLLQGEEYAAARDAADRVNRKMRNADPAAYEDMEIHEIHTVKFGGHPTDPANKIVLPVGQHRQLNGWWSRKQWSLERGMSK